MNLSVLDCNILHAFAGLAHGEEAECVYLAKRDSCAELASEAAALKWAEACRVIVPALRYAEAARGGADNGCLSFIRTRFLNMGASA